MSRLGVSYNGYTSSDLPELMTLIGTDLSEPYHLQTFRYFLDADAGWPHLCFTARAGFELVGVIVCRQSKHRRGRERGYIAMLSVRKDHRRQGIARRLVSMVVTAMKVTGADEIVLEAEADNTSALALYASLGWLRHKALYRFYVCS